MYVSQTSYVANMCSCGRKRTYSRVLIKSSTHVIQIRAIVGKTVDDTAGKSADEAVGDSVVNTVRKCAGDAVRKVVDEVMGDSIVGAIIGDVFGDTMGKLLVLLRFYSR